MKERWLDLVNIYQYEDNLKYFYAQSPKDGEKEILYQIYYYVPNGQKFKANKGKKVPLPNNPICAEVPLKASLHKHLHQLMLGTLWTKEIAWPASSISPPTASGPLAQDENLIEQTVVVLLPTE